MGSALRTAGFDVLIARNGVAGLELVRANRPSLVILDLAMPVMGGIEALRRLRADADPAVAATPVLIVSASSETKYAVDAGKLGVHGHMLKSRFSLVDLVARVREIVPGGREPV